MNPNNLNSFDTDSSVNFLLNIQEPANPCIADELIDLSYGINNPATLALGAITYDFPATFTHKLGCPVECELTHTNQNLAIDVTLDETTGDVTIFSTDLSLHETTVFFDITCISVNSDAIMRGDAETLSVTFLDTNAPCQATIVPPTSQACNLD